MTILTYFTHDNEIKDTDILAAFRVIPQLKVSYEKVAVAVAIESFTGTWTIAWTDWLTSLNHYKKYATT